ncbi:type IV secretory system conjugative DNA transfer family protein [Gordonia sputi]|uniref:type IV secretory system conjugative DNA transfer family protein n=1 Tax=Gordonia sputi TaxID=36823 RepID=UPI002044A8B6|nr:type IV secretory system conjugative DNA transfer family protein [Gordonia sputi]MCM3897101.1 type IV secretory system conjugative DNA transfer family protein [Gordonia sputi]
MDRISAPAHTRRQPPPLVDEPYAGFIDAPAGPDGATAIITDPTNRGRRDGDLAATMPHLFVPGGTGSGKSRRVLAPNIIRWGPRPCIALSSKDDLVKLTIRKRAQRGPVYLLDLSGTARESALADVPVTRVRIDPCALISTDNEALKMADLLLTITGGTEGDAKTWSDQARRPLTAILRAAGYYPDPDTGKRVWGGGVAWALDAAEDPGPDVDVDPDDEAPDLSVPDWNVAYLRALLQGSRHARSLLAVKRKDPRQRDSVGISIANALTAWSDDDVVGAGLVPFRPEMLTEAGATLYIVSPMVGNAGAAVSTLLVAVYDYWRHRVEQVDAGELRTVMFVLDEFTNGSKIPAKFANSWVGEGRGLGIRLVVALQDSSQLEALWGQAEAKVMRKIMPATLILPGAEEDEMLERAVKATPPEERVTASVDASGKASRSRDRVHAEVANLTPQRDGEARLLLRGRVGVRVRLPDIAETDLLD